jgi:predicted ATPase
VHDALPFTGRDAELNRLCQSLDAAVAGRGQLWLVHGEAGIGKSRLVEEFCARADGRARVFHGWAWEAGGAPAFWPWIQALRQLCDDAEPSALAAWLGTRASWIAQLLPELGEIAAPPALEPEQARFQLMDAVASLLRDAARAQPRVLVLEDLHAADASSLLLLEFLARDLRRSRLLVIGTYREAEARSGAVGALLARVGRHAQSLALARLGEREVAELLARALGSAAAAQAVFRSSEGNPLFVSESARLLLQGGELRAVPDGVRGAIRARLEALPEGTRELLSVASVIGRDFALEELALLAERSAAELAEALRPALDRALLEPAEGRRYRFSHYCIREVLHDELPDARRWALHRRLAEVLEARLGGPTSPPCSELAHHLLEAGLEARGAALDALERAAEHALFQLAFDDAASAYRAQLELAPALPERRAQALIGLGRALTFAGDAAGGRGAFERALELAREQRNPELVARAALGLGSELVFAEVDPALVRALEEALAGLGPEPSPLRAELMARLSAALQPAAEPREAIALAKSAIEMARAVGDRRTLLSALRNGCSALMDLADPAERLPLNAEMAALAAALHSPLDALRAAQRLAFDHVELGDRAQVVSAIEACAALAAELTHPIYRARAYALSAMLAIHDGRFEQAELQLDEARRLSARTRDRNASRSAALQRHSLARLRGDRQEMLARLREFEELEPPSFRGVLSNALAAEALAESDPLLARARLAAVDLPLVLRLGDASLIEALIYALDALGELGPLPALRELLLPRSERFVSWGAFGMLWGPPVRYLLGMIERLRGEPEAAISLLARAEEQCAAVQSAPQALRCAAERARALASAGRQREAEALGAELTRRAEVLGLPWPVAVSAARAAAAARVPAPVQPVVPARPAAPELCAVCEGETWWIRYAGGGLRLRDTKGVRLLARLLEEPGREFHVLDLVGAAGGESGLPLLDPAARAAYRRRAEDLRDELEEAERLSDAGRRERASSELEQLRSELARAVGLGGRERSAGGASERARVNVQRRLRDAIERIREQDGALARHLNWALRTGTFCSYDPS